jgi:hypothetical protein
LRAVCVSFAVCLLVSVEEEIENKGKYREERKREVARAGRGGIASLMTVLIILQMIIINIFHMLYKINSFCAKYYVKI